MITEHDFNLNATAEEKQPQPTIDIQEIFVTKTGDITNEIEVLFVDSKCVEVYKKSCE